VAIDNNFYGPTKQGQIVINGLPPGEAVAQVFSEGYQGATQKLQLVQDKPVEANFALELPRDINVWLVKESLFETIRGIGGIDGIASLGDFEGEGALDWMDKNGQMQHWPMTFSKHAGNDVTLLFKLKDGQCSASILGGSSKRECKGKAKGSGEEIADQAAAAFLKYQVQEVLQQMVQRAAGLSFQDGGKRLEISGSFDSYALTLDKDKLPSELLHSLTDKADSAVKVKYSNYTNVGKARYPAQMQIDWINRMSIWVFTISSVRSLASRI
jgi:hypothetical protein